MADFNENVLGFAAHSPKFLKQRKIAYVDNPFDETASHSMVQKYEYMNFRRDENGAGSPRVFGQSSEDKTSSNKGQDGLWSCGKTDLALSEQDWSFLFSPVQCHINSPAGEIQLSLSYDPWLANLKIAIIKAKGLTCSVCASKAHNSGIICVGTFVNVTLIHKNKQMQSRKTAMKTRKAEIFFYEKFSFVVQKDDIRDYSLHCQAVHKVGSLIKRCHVIGEVLIGGANSCDGNGLRHWEEMLGKPKKNVTKWHYIQEG